MMDIIHPLLEAVLFFITGLAIGWLIWGKR